MDKFENDVMTTYSEKTKLSPLVWLRSIDYVFFIWTHGSDNLDDFIQHTQCFSETNNMKSKIKFEINKSTTEINVLDVTIKLKDGKLHTTLYSKPTDAYLYLNKLSNHPKHVINNIPKGQFILIRRICSEKNEYMKHCNILLKAFVKRGYDQVILHTIVKEVGKIERQN